MLLHVQKIGENTQYVVNELAKYCGVPSRKAGWAGLKDRYALTEQWISIQLPEPEIPDFAEFERTHVGVRILDVQRHAKRLHPGDLQGNAFSLILRDVSDMDDVVQRLERIKQQGVPNYFGEQRFGLEGNNLTYARRWGKGEIKVSDRAKRSFYLSAARAYIFNQLLSYRIEHQMIQQLESGDLLLDKKSLQEILVRDTNIPLMMRGIEKGFYCLTGPMAGDNPLHTQGKIAQLEQSFLDEEPDLMKILRDSRMRQDRRPLILAVNNVQYQIQSLSQIQISFTLNAGSFATSVVRELITTE